MVAVLSCRVPAKLEVTVLTRMLLVRPFPPDGPVDEVLGDFAVCLVDSRPVGLGVVKLPFGAKSVVVVLIVVEP